MAGGAAGGVRSASEGVEKLGIVRLVDLERVERVHRPDRHRAPEAIVELVEHPRAEHVERAVLSPVLLVELLAAALLAEVVGERREPRVRRRATRSRAGDTRRTANRHPRRAGARSRRRYRPAVGSVTPAGGARRVRSRRRRRPRTSSSA